MKWFFFFCDLLDTRGSRQETAARWQTPEPPYVRRDTLTCLQQVCPYLASLWGAYIVWTQSCGAMPSAVMAASASRGHHVRGAEPRISAGRSRGATDAHMDAATLPAPAPPHHVSSLRSTAAPSTTGGNRPSKLLSLFVSSHQRSHVDSRER